MSMNASSKSDGTTSSERLLFTLCKSTFLSIWSYANVFRTTVQAVNGNGDGKEICDVLIVCGDHIVIFSDKSCALATDGDIKVNWKRWYKRAIAKSADQLIGARRWIYSHPDRVFLDRSCTTQLPVEITINSSTKVHLVVVASGAKEACQSLRKGDGSLRLRPSIVGDQHLAENASPFEIGIIYSNDAFIHVLDEVSLARVLDELNTVTDFVNYLSRKETFICSGRLLSAASELDLLACYMSHVADIGGHSFPPVADNEQLEIIEGYWRDHNSNDQVVRKRDADRISYEWDRIIEHFTHHTEAGTAIAGNVPSIAVAETPLRVMAMESRTNRRSLARAWIDLTCNHVSVGHGKFRTVLSETRDGVAYAFLCMPRGSEPDSEYIELRSKRLQAHIMTLPLRFSGLTWIIGIATEPSQSQIRTYDFAAMDTSRMLPEDLEVARLLLEDQIKSRRGPVKTFHSREDEYPNGIGSETHTLREVKRDTPRRNELCPCLSGKKYKKCCMRHAE
jgi:hypothetical protein